MKKKTISLLATIATATVIIITGAINSKIDTSLLNNSSASDSTAISQTLKNSEKTKTQDMAKSTPQSVSTTNKIATSGSNDTIQKQQTLQEGTTNFPSEIIKTEKEGIVPFGSIEANVTKVTDGDTFHITYDTQEYKVRMLDIDTPESVKSGIPPQPFAKEASELTKETLTDKKVKLIFEKDTTDQFDRLLAHVIIEDGTYYNAYMVEKGYAICVFYSPNTLLKEYFNKLQNHAIANKKGFWELDEKDRPFIKDSKGKYIAAYKKGKGKAA